MSVWLDSSGNSNKFKQSYFRDFVDVSGEVLIRNGLSLKLYNSNVPTRVQFSINSNEFRVYNDTDHTYYDISNTKLIYLQDLSENVQAKLSQVNTLQSALSLKANTSVVDASFASVNSVIATKASTSVVDASFDSIERAIATKAGLASPDLTGVPTAPTASAGTNTTQIATTAFVKSAVDTIIASAPAALDTLNELAAALGNDASFSSTVTNTLASKAPLANPTFTGTVNASKVAISSDASFNGRVDVCGNFYAKYPASSIPASAIIGGEYTIDISSNQTISGIKTFTNGLVIGEAEFNVINQTQTTSTQSDVVTINPTSTWSQTGGDFDGVATGNRTGRSIVINSEGNIIAVGSVATTGFGYVKVYTRAVNKTSADSYGPIGWNQIGQTINSTSATLGFAESIELNSDGYVLAFGHSLVNSNTGATYVYSYNTATNTWIQRGDTIVGEAVNNYSGRALSLSDDGTIIAIDAFGNSDGLTNRGHVRVYKYDANKTVANTNQSSSTFGPVGWNRLGQDIDGETAGDWSGFFTALSSDGTIVAIGAYAANNTRGQVRVYKYDVNKTTANADQSSPTYGPVGWNRLGQDIDGEPSTANYAGVVSLNSDGTIVAIGGYITNNNTGHVRVYKYDVNKTVADTNQSSSTFGPVGWNRLGQDIRGTAANQQFGHFLSLNSLGNILAVGMPGADGNRVRVYLYDINKTTEDLNTSSSTFGPVGWTRIGQDLTGPSGSQAGLSTRLNSVGNIVVFGAPGYNSNTGRAFVYSVPTTSSSSSVTTVVGSSIQINSAVDICGNFYAQYPSNSIPASAVNGISTTIQTALDLKATKTIVDASFTSVNSAIALKADLASPALTGVPTAPTATAGTNTTQLATTAFVTTAASTKANLASPALTGVPTAPTATVGTNTTQLATTAFVKSAVDNLVASAPAALDTLNELAAALGNDAAFSTTVTNTLALKAPLANPTFTGTVNASKVAISSDASFNGRVDICGNFYAQYPASSIPQNAIIGGISSSELVDLTTSQTISGVKTFSTQLNIGTNTLTPLAILAVSQMGSNLIGPGTSFAGSSTAVNDDGTIVAVGCSADSNFRGAIRVYQWSGTAWNQFGNDILSTTDNTQLGSSISLSSTGLILAAGGYAGNLVRVFQYANSSWTQLGSDITNIGPQAGTSISLSSDGLTVAIGAPRDFTVGENSGKTRICKYINGTWTQLGQDILGEAAQNYAGCSVALSADGTIVVIGANYNDGVINGTIGYMSGHARIYKYENSTWTQLGQDIDGENYYDMSGWGVAISDDGTIVAIGAPYNAPGGHVRVYKYANSTWTKLGQDIDGRSGSGSGNMVALSADGYTVAIGSQYATGLGGQSNQGYATLYKYDGTIWNQLGTYLEGQAAGDQFGYSLSLNSDGTTLAVGSPYNNSNTGNVKVYKIQNASSKIIVSNGFDICGNLYAQYPASSIPVTAIAANLATLSYVDSSLNAKASLAAPTFTGTVVSSGDLSLNSKLRVSGDASFNGRVDICGNFYAKYPASSIPVSAIAANLATVTYVDSSLNLKAPVAAPTFTGTVVSSGDASLNSKLRVSGDASFNGRVDICGNFYAKYPASSIPASAIVGVSDTLSVTNINISGNVGIGTTTPQAPLQVVGNSKIGSLNLTTISAQTGLVYDASWSQVGNTIQGMWWDLSGTLYASYCGWVTALNGDGTIMAHGSNSNYVNIYKYRTITLAEWNLVSTTNRTMPVAKHPDTVYDSTKKYWVQMGNSIIDIVGIDDGYAAVSLNEAGDTVVIGGVSDDTGGSNMGTCKVFKYNAATDAWNQVGQNIYGSVANEYFAGVVDINAAGNIIAAGGQNFNSYAGRVVVYRYDSAANQWNQIGQTFTGGKVGASLSLSSDGYTIAIAHADTMIARIYTYSEGTNLFVQNGGSIVSEAANDRNASSVSLNSDGTMVAVGASWATSQAGQARVYEYRFATAEEWAEVSTTLRSGVVVKNGDTTLNATKKYWVQIGNDVNGNGGRTGIGVSLRKHSVHGTTLAVMSTGSVKLFKYRTITQSEWNTTTTATYSSGLMKGNDTVYSSTKSYWIQLGYDRAISAAGGGSTVLDLNSDGTVLAFGSPLSTNYLNKANAGLLYVFNTPYVATNYQNDSIIDTLDNNARRNLVLNNTLSIDPSGVTTIAGRIDICGNLYAKYPDASIPASAINGVSTSIQTALNLKSDITYVDASLNLKANKSAVDASLNLKSDVTYVDASLNLKANLVSPTFTGPFVVASGDVSMNNNLSLGGDLIVKGNLSVFRQETNSIINTTINNYEIIITKDISLNGNLAIANNASLNSKLFVADDVSLNNKLFVNNDATLNSKLSVANDASFNGRVDICGNLYAQYPNSSIPASAITDGVTLSYVDASLNLKANQTYVDASLNLKSDLTYVDASLNLKSDITYVDASLNLKSDITYVDASLNLKSNLTYVDASLNLKSDVTYVDASLNLKSNLAYVDASLNLKSDVTYVDASLNLKSNLAYVDASLNVKPSFSQVDASLNLKSNLTYVDASLNLKSDITYVDTALNLKANLASPTFTGVPNAPTAAYDNSSNQVATTGFVQGRISSIINSAPAALDTLNELAAALGNDANYAATITNSLSQKANITDVNSALALKSNITYVDASLNLKSDITYVDTALNLKSNITYVDASLNLKSNLAYVDASLNLKSNLAYVDASLNLKSNLAYVDASLNLKSNITYVDASLNLKSNLAYVDASLNLKSDITYVDASLNLKSNLAYVDASLNVKPSFSQVDASLNLKSNLTYVDASLNLKSDITYVDTALNLKANLASPTFTGIPNAPTAAYDNSSNQLATTGFVQGRISSIINSAPAALDTLNELAAALGNDANYAATITNALSQKANITDVNSELALKSNLTYVDASLNLKSNLTYVDASLNLKSNLTYVDASLNLKSNLTYVDASLNLKSNLTYVDASLNLKSNLTYVDASLNVKPSFSQVDASLNLKADLASPTFTGTPNAPTAAYDNSSNQIATTGFVQGRISSIINSAPAALDTLNELAAALGNDANFAATVTNSLSQKANTTDVNAALALKANITSVDASLNLKSNLTYVDASLNAKPSFSQVDASLNLKSNLTYVDASLNVKPSFSQVDASLNLKSNLTYVDASLNLKSAVTYVDASLNLKSSLTYVDASLNVKPSFSQVDASLNLKSNVTYVDASLNAKPSFSQVDASLNLKADLASPTFTGTPNAPTAAYDNSSNQIATTGFVQGRISSIINSAPAALDTLNELAAALGNDANFAATVTNSLSQKANTTDVNAALALKANITSVDASLNLKSNLTYVDASLNLKSDLAYVDASLNLKSNVTYVDASLNLKSNLTYVDASLNAKPSFSQVDASLNLKSNLTYVDASLNAKPSFSQADASLNLKANLASPTFTGTPNAPTAAYDNSSNQIATTGFVQGRISSIINSAPAALDTLNELAAALGNDANFASTVTNSLSQKANITDVNTELALKATTTSVDASLNLKSNLTYVDASLNTKPSFSQVDASLNLKSNLTYVDASLNAKPSFSQVDASLNLKSNVTYVDASLNAKPSFSQVDASLNLKSNLTYVDASLNAKPSFSQVDASLNLKSNLTYVDVSLNAKPSFSQVDTSLNLKADLASPTFTGTPNAPTAAYDNSSNQIATTGFVQGRISSIINSAPAALDTLNELAAALGNDANFASTVTNSLSQKANTTDVNTSLALKASITSVDASLNLKSNITYVDASLNAKPSFSQVDASLNLKSNVTYVDASLNLKSAVTYVDASLNAKPSFSQVDASLNLKSAVTYVDASLNAKPSFSQVDTSLNLKANLISPTFTGTPNAPTAAYDNSSNQIATTGFVQGRISAIINSAPAALDTLNELAAALGNDANYAATVTNALSQKANITDVNTELALKATITSVDASLNLKSNITYVDASLNAKPSFSQVDASLNLKSDRTYVDASLNLKPATTYVDASLNLKSAVTYVDASLNLKPATTYVDASLNLKPSFSQVDASLNLKPSFSQVDASLNLKSSVTYVDASLNAKPSFSQVDASLNLMAALASPTFTGTPNAPTASYDNSSNQIATTGFVQGRISSIINSAPAALDTLNELAAALGNDANFAATVTNSLSQKANTTDVNTALALKATTTTVDASLNLKSNVTYVDASLNAKPSFSQVDASLNLKSNVTYVDASLNAKPSFSQVDASLNLKPSFSQVDASLNLKSNVTYVDASLNAKPSFSQVDVSLNLKSATTYVDASLNLKPSFSQVDASLNVKSDTTYVDASLNLKANAVSPTFTGIVTAPKLISGDASFNGNVDISGVLSVTQTVNSVVKNSTINNYNVSVTNDLSLNGKLVVSSDVSLNSKLYVKGDASFGRVDICGNFYAQYPNNSIPSSAISNGVTLSYVDTSLNLKSSVTYVDASLNLKANVTYVDTALNLKPSFSEVDASLNLKSSLTYVDTALNLKPSFSQVDTSLNLKANVTYVDTALNLKPSFSQVDTSLNLKANVTYVDTALNLKPSFSEVDASLNLKSAVTYVDASLNLKANLVSPTFTGTPNAPTAAYDNSSNQIATTGFVQGRISSIINSAPAALDTLNELAAALGNDANFAATVTNTLSQKANTTDVNSALALKATITSVDASLNLKPSFSQIDASLNLKPSFSQIDASLNLKPSFSQVDASLNLKPSFSQVDASLNLKSEVTYVDASLNLKPSFSQVDASLNLKSAVTYVDASLNLKPSFSQVDVSLNLKANLASPTFTGTPNAPTASYDNSSNQIATTGFVQGRISSIINSAPAALDTLNELAAALGNDANFAATVTNTLSQKANTTDVNTALALKPNFSQVDASLNLKPSFSQVDASLNLKSTVTYVDASLNLKPSFSQVDASLNLKSAVTYVDASLNLKPSFSQVDASLNLKSAVTYVDASLNLKPSFSQVDASLNLKSAVTYVDASLNLKPSFSQVDASLNLKPSFSQIDASLNLKSAVTYVDASLNLKASLASPTFTGTPNAPTADYDNSSNQIATTGFVQGRITSIINSAPAALDTLNELAAALGNDANFAATVTNSLSQKANINDVNTSLALKPSFSQVDASLNLKPSFAQVDASLNAIINSSQIDASLNLKPSFSQVDVSLNLKSNVTYVDASLNLKPSFSQVDASLNLKSAVTYVDASLNLKASLASPTFTGTPNAPTAAYDNSSNQIATTGFVQGRISSIINSAPAALDTLNELAAALGNDANFAATVTNSLSQKANATDVNSAVALKPSFSQVDASMNTKADLTYVDASLNLKAAVTYVDASLNLKAAVTYVDASLNLKPSFSQVDASLNLKSAVTYVDASLNLKAPLASPTFTGIPNAPTASYDNSSNQIATTGFVQGRISSIINSAPAALDTLNELAAALGNDANYAATITNSLSQKANTTDVNSALALKPSFAEVDASLNLKPTFAQVDASLNAILNVAQVDASLNLKPSFSQVDASLNLKPSFSQVDVSLNLKPSFVQVDASLNLKPSFSQVDASLNLKPNFSQVDASLNLKANVASPTFTGIVTASKLTSGDASFNGNVDISGVLSVTQTVNSVVKNTTINNYNVAVTNDLSLNGKLIVSSDVSLNSKLYVKGDASFNGRVDICGNFYAQYPASSIPSSAIIGGVSTGSVDISSNQTISGVKTFTNGIDINNTSLRSVIGVFDSNFQRVQIGQDIDGEAAGDQSGFSVSINSDGTIVAIGAPQNSGAGINAGHVRVYKNINGTWTQLGQDINGEAASDRSGHSVSLSSDGTIVAIGGRMNAGTSGTERGHVRVYKYNGSTWTKLGQDIDGEANYDESGRSVSISSDGTIVAIGAINNAGNGSQSGHVRVYQYNGSTTWTQLGSDINGEAASDQSGWSVSLSSDGTIVAVGAYTNDGNGSNSGHVRVYKYNGSTTWTQLGQDINGEAADDESGSSVSLSGDGTIVAIGAPKNDGIGTDGGHVRVYKYNGSTTWTQLGQDINGEAENNLSGCSVSLSSDGTILAIGAYNYALSNVVPARGHARIYEYSGTTWTQLGSNINGEAVSDQCGWAVSLSSDSKFVAVGGPFNDNGSGTNSGHVRVYQIRNASLSKLTVNNNVDICGNFYAQYPAASIPASAINGISSAIQTAIDLKATKTIVDASFTSVNSAIALKANLASPALTGVPTAPTASAGTNTTQLATTEFTTTAVSTKANLASPALTGVPTAPTAAAGTNTTQIATTAFVKSAVDNLVASAPAALDTLNELAAALGSDASFSTTVTNSLASKAPLANPTFTGTINASKVSISSDASFNGRVDICGNFYAKYPASSIPASAIIGGVGGGGSFDPNTDLSLNQKLAVGGDVSLNRNVDIGGNVIVGAYSYTSPVIDASSQWVQLGSAINGQFAGDMFGSWDGLDMNADGTIIVLGGHQYSSNTGRAVVYKYINSAWTQLGQTIVGSGTNVYCGVFTSINAAGDIIAVSSTYTDVSYTDSGSVTIYKYNTSSSLWVQLGQTLNGPAVNAHFGFDIELNADGYTIVIGNGDLNQCFVYRYNGTSTWNQLGNTITGATGDVLGLSVTINDAGNIVALGTLPTTIKVFSLVGSTWTILGATIVTGATSGRYDKLALSSDGYTLIAGEPNNQQHAIIYRYNGSAWSQLGQTITETGVVYFGGDVAINFDGTVVAIGAAYTSASAGSNAGRVFSYKYNGTSWVRIGQSIDGIAAGNLCGLTVSLSRDGTILAAGSPNYGGNLGQVRVYSIPHTGGYAASGSLNVINSASINSTLTVVGNTTLSTVTASKLALTSDASFSGRVDVCGNFYAKYPASSIPASAIIGGVGGGSAFATDICVNSITIGRGGGNSSFSNAVGINALGRNTTGGFNVAVGTNSLFSNLTGNQNVAMNFNALYANTSGSDNVAIGIQALQTNQTGSNNVGIGSLAIQGITSSNNTAVGYRSLVYSSTGSSNTAFGYLAGGNNSTGSFNTYIGYGADVPAFGATWSNSTAIGANAMITASNQITLGTAAERVFMPGKLTTTGDASFNGRVDISGNATASKMRVTSDASFNGRVDICGNFYAQYPASSIPQSAIIGGVGGGSSVVDLTTSQTITGTKTFSNQINIGSNAITQLATLAVSQIGTNLLGPGTSFAGSATALNDAGTIVAVGCSAHSNFRGAVRVYQWSGTTWTQLGNDILSTTDNTQLGNAVSLSANGLILAAGGYQANLVRVFEYANGTWTKLGADITNIGPHAGTSVSLSADGLTVAIGAPRDYAVGENSGKTRICKYINGTWTQLGQDILGEAMQNYAGCSVALSADGTIVVIGANYNDGAGTNGLIRYMCGQARVYKYANSTWTQLGQDIDGENNYDMSGWGVAISDDGTIVAIGAPYNAPGGHVRVYKYANSTWTKLGQDIDGRSGSGSGNMVALSADGYTVAIGSQYATGLGGQSNQGYAVVYKYNGSTWSMVGSYIEGQAAGDQFGYSVALSSDGTILSGGSPYNNSSTGNVKVYKIQTASSKVIVSDGVDICGNLYANTLQLSSSATFNGRVDICGNFYAQYPPNSIPASAIIGGVGSSVSSSGSSGSSTGANVTFTDSFALIKEAVVVDPAATLLRQF